MTLDADPYRTLGLSRGATLDEVKRAYRRLAKANHPDAAGAAALPRFLAIQAAYELLAGGSDAPRARGAASAPRRPSTADADRSEGTRRAYGSRTRGPRPGATGGSGPAGPAETGGASGTSGPKNDGSGARRASQGPSRGPRRPAEPRGGPTGPSTDGRRRPEDGPPNKATLGSTSYDGADTGPFEPDWGGASWYGTTSGTYWTLNPKEYADPRKHGPEYQARARRAARARASAANPAGDADATRDPAAGPMHTTSSWWDSTAGPTGTPSDAEGSASERARAPGRAAPTAAAPDVPPPDLGRAAADFVHALLDERSGGLRGRAIRAVIGWLPIALGFGWLVGELTGCGRFAATCDGAADPFVLVVQVAALVVLFLLPALASLTAMASIALLSTAVVASLILSATGTAADAESRRVALGALLVVAWLAGLAVASIRRVRTLGHTTSPVS